MTELKLWHLKNIWGVVSATSNIKMLAFMLELIFCLKWREKAASETEIKVGALGKGRNSTELG